ncbi:flavin reductase family protein [Fumia xinanensis]|uniref:Flavin reductase family protein n=1 Tax=Fumia xinanensis TaxID=2763659 RepID=A0A926I5Z7_9FIRM|nr:flavin reductase family protein [Fumia xinanensis]MBC8558464.1 flavin reductase family protein [Fumia xinanensis]
MGKQVWKPGTMVSPVPPVMVSCGSLEKPNILTIAWTGIVNTIPAMTYISVRPQRFSYPLIKESREFVINLTTRALTWAADYCGVKSGADTDKFSVCKLTPAPASQVGAPLIKESPVNIECRVNQVIPLGSHDMFLAEIVAVNVDEVLVDQNGKLHLDQSGLVAYSHGEYFALGEKLGSFGYSVRKKPKNNPASRKKRLGKRKRA